MIVYLQCSIGARHGTFEVQLLLGRQSSFAVKDAAFSRVNNKTNVRDSLDSSDDFSGVSDGYILLGSPVDLPK